MKKWNYYWNDPATYLRDKTWLKMAHRNRKISDEVARLQRKIDKLTAQREHNFREWQAGRGE